MQENKTIMLDCIIVDDEPLAREGLANYVKEADFLRLVATCDNPVALTKTLNQSPADLIFLDIQMPKMSGIDFLKMTANPPMVIITTAYPGYAVEGFQLNVLDYLLKPITFDRFFKSVSKAKDYYALINKDETGDIRANAEADYFFIKCGSKYEKIVFNDILYIEGMQNYVTIYTNKGKYITLLYLRHLEENLDTEAFVRVHKSYIVAINKIEAIDNNEILIGSQRISIGRNYKDQVIKQVIGSHLWDKLKFTPRITDHGN